MGSEMCIRDSPKPRSNFQWELVKIPQYFVILKVESFKAFSVKSIVESFLKKFGRARGVDKFDLRARNALFVNQRPKVNEVKRNHDQVTDGLNHFPVFPKISDIEKRTADKKMQQKFEKNKFGPRRSAARFERQFHSLKSFSKIFDVLSDLGIWSETLGVEQSFKVRMKVRVKMRVNLLERKCILRVRPKRHKKSPGQEFLAKANRTLINLKVRCLIFHLRQNGVEGVEFRVEERVGQRIGKV